MVKAQTKRLFIFTKQAQENTELLYMRLSDLVLGVCKMKKDDYDASGWEPG